MAPFVALALLAPITAPIGLFGAAIATLAGVRVLKARIAGDTFLAELVFSVLMGLINLLIALQVMWTVGAIDL